VPWFAPLTRFLAATGVSAGTRLLEVGCGSGLLLDIARVRGATVTGLDVSPGLLAAAHDRVPDAGVISMRNVFRWVSAVRL
jgi:cyclopropane fatty-acyl-phospholipid synthase-like methyltransferase